jgi:hypothetical protein
MGLCAARLNLRRVLYLCHVDGLQPSLVSDLNSAAILNVQYAIKGHKSITQFFELTPS